MGMIEKPDEEPVDDDKQADQDAGGFKKPDVSQFVPADVKDVVDRVVAAGMKVMYSPAMRSTVMEQVQRDDPVAQKLAECAAGLMLTLDQRSKGGIPMAALFPAALTLLGEMAEALVAAKQPVTQDDFNEAAMRLCVLMGRKLGADDEQIMNGLQRALPQGAE
jgi:hypothetical protein